MAPLDAADMAFPDVQPNAQVHHPTFGQGKVVKRSGTTEKTAKAIIKFREAEGEKKLALRFADLTVDKVEEELAAAEGAEGLPDAETKTEEGKDGEKPAEDATTDKKD